MAGAETDDLAQLSKLDETEILKKLRERYAKDKIYTSCGEILIAINPNKNLPIFDDEHHYQYDWRKFDAKAKPHIFQMATRAYQRMRENGTNQVILVSGESGAGKTESTKLMVKHFIHMCPRGSEDIHDKVVKVNLLLEAFGNAQTIMNQNSSRFAKYLELSFQDDGQVLKAAVTDYMLEKSRVVNYSDDEGNFHIFYSLFAGASPEQLAELSLTKAKDYKILNKGSSHLLEKTDEYRQMYHDNMSILKQIGFTQKDFVILHCMLGAILHLTQVEFEESEKQNEPLDIIHIEQVDLAAKLLDVDTMDLNLALIQTKSDYGGFGGEKIHKLKSLDQAREGRDALAKAIYERLFGWVIKTTNKTLSPSMDQRLTSSACIGVLDMAGFENLQQNSFEQLCINFVNEQLQNFMNDKVFKHEKQIYEEEGIPCSDVNFTNNSVILEVFTKSNIGILSLLDEETKLPGGTDKNFVFKVTSNHNDSGVVVKSRADDPEFGINHFAGKVWYTCKGFLEKNRDMINDDLLDCMKKSTNPFIQDLFDVKKGPTGTISEEPFNLRQSQRIAAGRGHGKTLSEDAKKLTRDLRISIKRYKMTRDLEDSFSSKKHATVLSYFRESMNNLLKKLKKAESHFVRCIKPNSNKQKENFDATMIREQLLYNGITEIAKIRKQGFSIRSSHKDFYKRYNVLNSCFPSQTFQPGKSTKELLDRFLPEHLKTKYRVGKNKVFLKGPVHMYLEKLLYNREQRARKIIAKWCSQCMEKKRKLKELEDKKTTGVSSKPTASTHPSSSSNFGNSFNTSSTGQSRFDDMDLLRTKGPNGKTVAIEGKQETSNRVFLNLRKGSNKALTKTHDEFDPYHSEPKMPKNKAKDPKPKSASRFPDPPAQDTKNKKEEDNKKEKESWDVFTTIPREGKSEDVHERRTLRIIKVIMYGLFFLIMISALVFQKISLMLLVHTQNRTFSKLGMDSNYTKEAYKKEEGLYNSSRYLLLLVAMCIPYVLTLIMSILKWLFGNAPNPNKKTLIFSIFMELCHSVALSLLVFRYLKEMHAARGIMVMSSTCILPGVLKTFCFIFAKCYQKSTEKTTCKKISTFIGDVAAAVFQISCIPLVMKIDFLVEEENAIGDWQIITGITFCLLFCSFSWWENFIDDQSFGNTESTFQQWILEIKYDLQESRPLITMVTSLLKIFLTGVMAYVFNEDLNLDPSAVVESISRPKYENYLILNPVIRNNFKSRNVGMDTYDQVKDFTSIICITVGSYIAYYVSYTACKLQMQKVSFSLAVLLSTPVAVLLVELDCYYDILEPVTKEELYCFNYQIYDKKHWYHFVFGFIVLISTYWITRYIWFPHQEKLAKIERLFVNPFYCSILLEQHLLMNRKRQIKRIRKTEDGNNVTYKLIQDQVKASIDDDQTKSDQTRPDQSESDKSGSDKSGSDQSKSDQFKSEKIPPMLYACATMWHETKQEMVQLLKSLFRVDQDQGVRKQAVEFAQLETPERQIDLEKFEFYEFQAHIMFDDAFEMDEKGDMVPNEYVKKLMENMQEAVNAVHHKEVRLLPPLIYPAPYGAQLVFEMPGENLMYVHLKDKNKIRHRKRWSQVMYMYYLLGYRIINECKERVCTAYENKTFSDLVGWKDKRIGKHRRGKLFDVMSDEVVYRAENTFILALDGDVDFTPTAVRLLMDKMLKNEDVAASCGRIHPIGKGPVVWYQKFEYAVAHWLQKATEHVLGCVLCSPGCFSLFRGSALMDDNIMNKYTSKATEASHYLMYDQGEDRWLCNLLLQQGYRVDYVAASDASTYVPEGFGEFFNQRRRWMPSTIANITDLLTDAHITVGINNNISWLYIIYQGALMLSTLIGPATVIMMIAGAYLTVFQIDLLASYAIALAPAILYVFL